MITKFAPGHVAMPDKRGRKDVCVVCRDRVCGEREVARCLLGKIDDEAAGRLSNHPGGAFIYPG